MGIETKFQEDQPLDATAFESKYPVLTISRDAKFFIAICRRGKHSYLIAGCDDRNKPGTRHILLAVGKQLLEESGTIELVTQFLSTKKSAIFDERIIKPSHIKRTDRTLHVPYKAYEISYTQYCELIQYLNMTEYAARENQPAYKPGITFDDAYELYSHDVNYYYEIASTSHERTFAYSGGQVVARVQDVLEECRKLVDCLALLKETSTSLKLLNASKEEQQKFDDLAAQLPKVYEKAKQDFANTEYFSHDEFYTFIQPFNHFATQCEKFEYDHLLNTAGRQFLYGYAENHSAKLPTVSACKEYLSWLTKNQEICPLLITPLKLQELQSLIDQALILKSKQFLTPEEFHALTNPFIVFADQLANDENIKANHAVMAGLNAKYGKKISQFQINAISNIICSPHALHEVIRQTEQNNGQGHQETVAFTQQSEFQRNYYIKYLRDDCRHAAVDILKNVLGIHDPNVSHVAIAPLAHTVKVRSGKIIDELVLYPQPAPLEWQEKYPHQYAALQILFKQIIALIHKKKTTEADQLLILYNSIGENLRYFKGLHLETLLNRHREAIIGLTNPDNHERLEQASIYNKQQFIMLKLATLAHQEKDHQDIEKRYQSELITLKMTLDRLENTTQLQHDSKDVAKKQQLTAIYKHVVALKQAKNTDGRTLKLTKVLYQTNYLCDPSNVTDKALKDYRRLARSFCKAPSTWQNLAAAMLIVSGLLIAGVSLGASAVTTVMSAGTLLPLTLTPAVGSVVGLGLFAAGSALLLKNMRATSLVNNNASHKKQMADNMRFFTHAPTKKLNPPLSSAAKYPTSSLG